MPAEIVLRHSIVPYRTLGTLSVASLVVSFVVSFRAGKWGFFQSVLLLSALYSLQVGMGLWYRVSLVQGSIVQHAFGMRAVTISVANVTSVGRHVSNARELAAMNRPFRRIVIEGRSQDRQAARIDISLKHFRLADIRDLMDAIREHRPDLKLPEV